MPLLTGAGQTVAMASFEMKVIRADGTVEDLGVVSYYHRNPLKRWAWKFSQWRRGVTAGRITGAAHG